MKNSDFAGIVPVQYTGKEVEADASVELQNENDAIAFYNVAKGRLLNVNNWHQVAGIISATFQIVDENGSEVSRSLQKGDFIKIDIPGPGSSAGDGYDWVCLEDIKQVENVDLQCIGFRVRPSGNPCGDTKETAHFYSKEASSSFMVTRENLKVTAVIVDHNLKPNDYATTLTDKIRDSAVGTSAIGLFSKIQWQKLVTGMVEIEK